jgi:hypothetical protein
MDLDNGRALHSGPFDVEHPSLQSGMHAWVERQTRHPLGYVEQLYTFADSDRRQREDGARTISISYLGLTRAERRAGTLAAWLDRRHLSPDPGFPQLEFLNLSRSS